MKTCPAHYIKRAQGVHGIKTTLGKLIMPNETVSIVNMLRVSQKEHIFKSF